MSTTNRPTGRTWRDSAACREEDPELFWPAGYTGPGALQAEQAKAVCRTRCPVMGQCGEFAIDTRQDDGVWGGLTPDERKSIRRRAERDRAAARQAAAQ